MSHAATTAVFATSLPPAEKMLALVLADHADPAGENIYPTQTRMAQMASMGVRTVRRILAKLVGLGILELVDPPVQHRPARYRLDYGKLAALRPANLAGLESGQGGQREQARPATQPARPANISAEELTTEPTRSGESNPVVDDMKAGGASSAPPGPRRDRMLEATVKEPDADFILACPEPYRSAWGLHPEWWVSCEDGYPQLDLQREASKYMAHWMGQPPATRPKNHRAAFRNWLRISENELSKRDQFRGMLKAVRQ